MTIMEDDMAYLVKRLWGNVWNDTEYEDVSRQNGIQDSTGINDVVMFMPSIYRCWKWFPRYCGK